MLVGTVLVGTVLVGVDSTDTVVGGSGTVVDGAASEPSGLDVRPNDSGEELEQAAVTVSIDATPTVTRSESIRNIARVQHRLSHYTRSVHPAPQVDVV